MFARLEQVKNYFNSLSSIQKRNFFVIVVLLLVLPLTVIVAQIQQDLRQRASSPPISTPLPPPGIFVKALKVNRVAVAPMYAPPLITSGVFTVEAWIKKDAFTNQYAEAHYVFSQGSYGSGINVSMWIGGQVQLNNGQAGYIQTTFWDAGGPQALNSTSSALMTTGEWHHVALVRDGTTARIYLDGSVVASKPSSGFVPFTNSQGMSIGSQITSPPNDGYSMGNDKFAGLIDEVRVSSIARYTFNFGVPTYPFSPDSSTIALYHFDNDTQDASGNNRHNQVSRTVEYMDSDLFTPPTPTPLPPTPTSAPLIPWWPFNPDPEPTPTPYVAPITPAPTTTSLIPVSPGQCPSGSSPQCLGYTTASGKTANCYTASGQFTADICLYSCGSCGYITPSPSAVANPTPTSTSSAPSYTTCPAGTVREECIGYTANNMNMYCWGGTGSTYLGGAYAAKCEIGSTPTPAATAGACADECYSDDLRTNIGKSNGVCNSGVISTSHTCPSATYNGKTFSCGGRTYTCNGYWQ